MLRNKGKPCRIENEMSYWITGDLFPIKPSLIDTLSDARIKYTTLIHLLAVPKDEDVTDKITNALDDLANECIIGEVFFKAFEEFHLGDCSLSDFMRLFREVIREYQLAGYTFNAIAKDLKLLFG